MCLNLEGTSKNVPLLKRHGHFLIHRLTDLSSAYSITRLLEMLGFWGDDFFLFQQIFIVPGTVLGHDL